MDRQKVIEYIASLDYKEKGKLLDEVKALEFKEMDKKYESNKKSYENQKKKHEIQGELMKNTVKVGDIVKCRGTNDGQGIREVIKCDGSGITARKIEKRVEYIRDLSDYTKTSKITYIRASYITQHYWEKVVEILDIEIHEED